MQSARFRTYLGLAVASFLCTPTLAQTEDPSASTNGAPWRIVLEQQLRNEKSCDLLEVLIFDETKRDGETQLEGKISCVDGRQYDFSRRFEHQKFELDLCEPTVC